MTSADAVSCNTAQGDLASANAKMLAETLDLGDALGELLVRQGLATVAQIAGASVDTLRTVGVLAVATAVELKARAEEHLVATAPEPVAGNSEDLTKPDIQPNAAEAGGPAAGKKISAAAERMRASRQRRKKGLQCFTLELRNTEVDALVSKGLLDAAMRADGKAILEALYQHLDATLKAPTA